MQAIRLTLCASLLLALLPVLAPPLAPDAAIAQTIELEPIATGLPIPVGLVHAGDGSGRLFIVLRQGRIAIWSGGAVTGTFLDISAVVSCCASEQGLLGLAFHPQYPTNGLFYVNYTNLAGNTVVARYQVSGNPNVANPATATTILTVGQPAANHNGGHLAFGPGGYLYIGLPAGQQDAARTFTGAWCASGVPGVGADTLWACGGSGDTYRWRPTIPAAGTYRVLEQHGAHPNRSTAVRYRIVHAGGTTTLMVNQQVNGGTWNLLGQFAFGAGTGGFVEVLEGPNGATSADAIRLEPVP